MEGVEDGLNGWFLVAGGEGGRVHAALNDWRDGPDDDVGPERGQCQTGDKGDAGASCDEPLDGDVVIDVETDARGEAGGRARLDEGVGVGVSRRAGGDPVPGGKVMQIDP
jgi:hypothetical protein